MAASRLKSSVQNTANGPDTTPDSVQHSHFRATEVSFRCLMRRILITALVAVHLVASLWHGNLHSQLSINLSPTQTLFVLVVILLAPIVAAALVWTRYDFSGVWVFFLSMLGSFLFGVYHHYVMVS